MHLELLVRYQWYSNSNIVTVETYGAQSNEKNKLNTTYCAPLIPLTASKPTKPKFDNFLLLFS